MVAPGDSPGTVFGIPEMFGIPVMGSVEAGTVVVFGTGSVTADTVGLGGAMVGATVMIGTAAAELMPRLPISVEPIGMPVRDTPPGVIGDVGVDDAARLPEPAPHMLWVPDVSIRADVGGTPEEDEEDIAVMPCSVTAPTATPPPSNEVVDPNIVDGAIPMVEHAALPVMPVMPFATSGAGLTPGEAISVAPNGMPVPPTGALGTMPSGDVTESEGVGITAACCATAWPQRRAEAAVIIRKRFMVFSSVIRSARRTRGAKSAQASAWLLGKIGPEDARRRPEDILRTNGSHTDVCAASSTAAQRQRGVGVQLVPVEAIGITGAVSIAVSAKAMQGVLVESGAMRAEVSDAADMATAKTSQMFAASHAADMGSAAKASDVAAAKAAAHMAATAATTASLGSARQQARG